MQIGRHVTRSVLIERLERCREQETGAGFSLTYGSQRRIGSYRVRIFGVKPEFQQFMPITEWIIPGDLF